MNGISRIAWVGGVAAGLTGGASEATSADKNPALLGGHDQPRILMVVTNHEQLGDTERRTGFYLSEVSHPVNVFLQAGFAIELVSPRGGPAPMDGVDRTDEINAAFLDDPLKMAAVESTRPADGVSAAAYEAIFFAGGHGTMWDLPENAALQDLTAAIYEQGGVVGAVCHGPAGLVNVRLSDGRYLVDGQRVAAFTNAEESAVGLTQAMPFLLETRLRERGAEFVAADNFAPNV
ncbi:MAG: type 1 glutamine amidotransferase domain-containing protein, partial [Planctomycetota bacterium]